MPKKLFSYVRVSTDLQTEKETYENQISEIKLFLTGKDCEIIQEFRDLGITGSDDNRPNFQNMISTLQSCDGIVIYDLDRLTRNFDMGINLFLILKNTHKLLYVARTKEILDFTNSSEQLMTIIKCWVSEQERVKIKDRQKVGIQRYKENNGRWGRKRKAVNWKKYDEYRELGLSKSACAKLLGIGINTFYRNLKNRKLVNAAL